MRTALLSLAVIVAGALASAASAQTFSGTFDPGVSGPVLVFDVPLPNGPATYDVSFNLSRDAFDGVVQAGYDSAFNLVDIDTGQSVGGNENFINPVLFLGPGVRDGGFRMQVPRDYRRYIGFLATGPAYEYGFYFNVFADFAAAFDGADPVDYTFSVRSVPEPGVWALSLVGFALAGAALRRRRESAAA